MFFDATDNFIDIPKICGIRALYIEREPTRLHTKKIVFSGCYT